MRAADDYCDDDYSAEDQDQTAELTSCIGMLISLPTTMRLYRIPILAITDGHSKGFVAGSNRELPVAGERNDTVL